jgi:hypothetical protein
MSNISTRVKVWGGPGCGKTTKEMEFYQLFNKLGYSNSGRVPEL